MGKNVSVSHPFGARGGNGHSSTDGGRGNWWTLSGVETDNVHQNVTYVHSDPAPHTYCQKFTKIWKQRCS